LGIESTETLRKWVHIDEVDAGRRPGADDAGVGWGTPVAAEPRSYAGRMRAAVGFHRGRARPATAALVSFITGHADRVSVDRPLWGVEPITRVLSEHGVPIAPSTCYDAIRAR
jgi:hypothetical protein